MESIQGYQIPRPQVMAMASRYVFVRSSKRIAVAISSMFALVVFTGTPSPQQWLSAADRADLPPAITSRGSVEPPTSIHLAGNMGSPAPRSHTHVSPCVSSHYLSHFSMVGTTVSTRAPTPSLVVQIGRSPPGVRRPLISPDSPTPFHWQHSPRSLQSTNQRAHLLSHPIRSQPLLLQGGLENHAEQVARLGRPLEGAQVAAVVDRRLATRHTDGRGFFPDNLGAVVAERHRCVLLLREICMCGVRMVK
jgi:hypothetical protein